MVTIIFTTFAIGFMVYCVYCFYEIWQDDQRQKKRLAEKRKNKPFGKMQYDCTENFYEQDFK